MGSRFTADHHDDPRPEGERVNRTRTADSEVIRWQSGSGATTAEVMAYDDGEIHVRILRGGEELSLVTVERERHAGGERITPIRRSQALRRLLGAQS